MSEIEDPSDALTMDGASDAPSASLEDAAPKRIVHYALRREIGRGALSVVYEAEDTRTGQEVALKLLTLPASLTPEEAGSLTTGFEREARTAARLSHPNIVRIYEIGVHENGTEPSQHFLAMEYLKGQTLRKRISAGRVTPAEAFPILFQIAGALDAVHQAGITHRDVKPTNVMLLPDGRVVLLDFGIAQSAEETAASAASADRGILVGSPSYMAPEQIKGSPAAAATDIWALGVLSYEILAGRLPFTGPNVGGVMYQIIHQPPASMPHLSLAVQRVLLRVLDKQPSQRYPAASAFVQALKLAYQRQVPITPEQKPVASSLFALPKWLPGAALLFLLLVGAGGIILVRPHLRPAQAAAADPAQTVPAAVVPATSADVQSVLPHVPQPLQTAPTPVSVPPKSLPQVVPAGTPIKAVQVKQFSAPLKQAAVPVRPMHAAPTMASVPVRPVHAAPTMASVPVRPRHSSAVNKLVTLASAAHQPGPASVPIRQVVVRVDSYPAQEQAGSQPVLVRRQAPAQSATSAGTQTLVQKVSQNSNEQTFSLPSSGDSDNLEADARRRKSAWSQEGAASPF